MISAHDRSVLRELARRKAEIGHLPVQRETFEGWRRLNRLQRTRPMVWINELPWHELAGDPFLQPRCQDPLLQGVESGLRMELYQWDHFRCDMVVEPVIYSALVGGPGSSYADYGIREKVERAQDGLDVVYQPVIDSLADADRIRTPRVWYDRQATERNYQTLCEVFDGVLPVRRRGIVHQWHAAWDQIIHWYGVERMYLDMYDRPELLHRVLGNFFRALTQVLDAQEELGMLDVGNGNWRVGSGGMGITDELPSENPDAHRVGPREQWGCATAQIFSEVSPAMHEEFSLQYERPLLLRYGLTYYGCCEPLHTKLGILQSITNLRKVSMSPKCDPRVMAEQVGRRYVLSFKPNPAQLATDDFDPAGVRDYLRQTLEITRHSPVEVILKDVSTVRNDPRRLDEWARVAMEVAQELA